MKGVLKLISFDKVVEGMQVVVYKDGKPRTGIITSLSQQKGFLNTRLTDRRNKPIFGDPVYSSYEQTFQIVIEYEESILKNGKPQKVATYLTGEPAYVHITKTLPLHPGDWKKALPLIGKEVDWVHDGWDAPSTFVEVAKLILPKQEESWSQWVKMHNLPITGYILAYLETHLQPPKPKQ